MSTPPALAPAGTEVLPSSTSTAAPAAAAAAPGTPWRRRGRHLSLVVAAALGAGGLLPTATAVAAEEATSVDERARPAGGAAAATPGKPSRGTQVQRGPAQGAPVQAEEVQLAAAVAVVAAATGGSYVVQPGDTVGGIARRSGLSQQEVIAANGLDASGSIRAGQTLRLDRAVAAAASPEGAYVVQPGDTVSAIAARTGTSQRAIVEANGLDSRASIRAGQTLRLSGTSAAAPAPSTSPAPAGSRSGTYTVQPGDSLSTIARRQGTTVAALRQVNPGVGADGLIRVGQQLSVPGGASTEPAPSSSAPVPSTFLGHSYPSSTTQSATANRDALAARPVPSRDEMRQMVRDTALRWGVDPALAQAVAFQESGFNMRAVSPANAVGVMQVIPSSGRWASDLAGQDIDLLDPQDNVTAGVVLLRSLARSAPDEATAIAGYYQGLSSVRSRGMYADTRRYVASVQTLERQYR